MRSVSLTRSSAASWTIVEDRAPVVTIGGAPRIESYHEYHHFEFAADVPNSSFYCSLDEEPFAPCASGGYRYVKVEGEDGLDTIDGKLRGWSYGIELSL